MVVHREAARAGLLRALVDRAFYPTWMAPSRASHPNVVVPRQPDSRRYAAREGATHVLVELQTLEASDG
jgi:hypothetical protein